MNLLSSSEFTTILLGFLSFMTIGCKSVQEDAIFLSMDQFENLEGSLPVALEIEANLDNDIILLEEVDGISTEIPFQIDTVANKLWFLTQIEKNPAKAPNYYILKGDRGHRTPAVSLAKTKSDLQFSLGATNVLSYRYGITYPPDGVDSIYRKSGYIHPLITPKGDTLTRIQPPDHYHHYGIWGPWTRTKIENRSVDFWNLGEGQGTVLFKEIKDMRSGLLFSEMEAVQEHIDLLAAADKRIALAENLKIRLWKLNHPERYMVDYNSSFSSPLQSGILFEAYRYGGGLGMRFTERWHKGNTSVLTSEGKDRLTADGTKARWCLVTGTSSDGEGTNGVLFLSHPENRSHPEPMRVWPIDANNQRGDMFFEFCPIRNKEWQIDADQVYELKYRMIIFEGALSSQEAESYWQHFASPPKISIESNIKSN
ncbi:MAG: PmoA family protein [Flavobacteriaceae bacterium]